MGGLDEASVTNGTTNTKPLNTISPNSSINLDIGDPVLFEPYWRKMGEKCRVVIEGGDFMSYLSDPGSVCDYMLPELREAIKRIHALVGNAVIDDKHIVVGIGSLQLFQACWFALSPQDPSKPVNVINAAPYYSSYESATDIIGSKLFKWGGDAAAYDKNEPYIEVVTSPNNPDGTIRKPVAKSEAEGKLVYDFAYYWPQYTPITYKADHDIMLFTFSKCTGHAGSRVGWALVRDIEVAKKMAYFTNVTSFGPSKESQIRAAKIFGVLCDSYQNLGSLKYEHFFVYGRSLLKKRWEKLREVVDQSKVLTLIKSTEAHYCNFTDESFETYPAFAWLWSKDEGIDDCESYLKSFGILSRAGKMFGVGTKFARLSLMSNDNVFDELLIRLSNANGKSD